jgi:hypothetical protein
VNIFGVIRNITLVIGKIIRWMVTEFLTGLMEEVMKGSIAMIRNMVKDYSNGILLKL